MKKILVVNGMGGSGKDTFVNYLKQFVRTAHISIVDNVKQTASEYGWTGAKDEKSRKFLSDLKLAVDNFNDGNYEYVRSEIRGFLDDSFFYYGYEILCIDMREPKQIDQLKKEFDVTTIFIDRNVPKIMSNPADAGVYEYQYDYVIDNNGTLEELKQSASTLIKTLRAKETNKKDEKKETEATTNYKKEIVEDLKEFIKGIKDILQKL